MTDPAKPADALVDGIVRDVCELEYDPYPGQPDDEVRCSVQELTTILEGSPHIAELRARPTRETYDGVYADYMRRHKDACDLKQQVWDLEAKLAACEDARWQITHERDEARRDAVVFRDKLAACEAALRKVRERLGDFDIVDWPGAITIIDEHLSTAAPKQETTDD